MKHQYRITVESLSDTGNGPDSTMRFDVENHDNIFTIVERLKQREEFSEDEAKAFGVGLKLFSEVMLKNKNAPLFSGFLPHFIDFMKELKKG